MLWRPARAATFSVSAAPGIVATRLESTLYQEAIMKIAILGWGSLLWEPGEFFNEWITAWQPDGPELDIEFSRISRKRGGALTLVIDETNGASTKVAWCLSKRKLLE